MSSSSSSIKIFASMLPPSNNTFQHRLNLPAAVPTSSGRSIPAAVTSSAVTSAPVSSAAITSAASQPSKCVRVEIRGRVQGVCFRDWTVQNARDLGLRGWVRNRSDGSVEAVFAGEADAVNEMVERRCRIGPPYSAVTGIACFPWDEDPGQGFQRFNLPPPLLPPSVRPPPPRVAAPAPSLSPTTSFYAKRRPFSDCESRTR